MKASKLLTSLALVGAMLTGTLTGAVNASAVQGNTDLGDYIPITFGGDGTDNFNLDLRAYGGYGQYYLTALLHSASGTELTDNTSFRYSPIVVTYIGTDENGDPVFQVDYDATTTKVDFDLLNASGNSVLDEVITVVIENPGTAGSFTLTVPAASYALESGNYTASAVAYGPDAEAEIDDSSVVYDETAGTITADFSYDDNTSLVYFQILDANGELIAFPASAVEITNPGTAGTGTVVLDLSKVDVDLSDYDLSSFTVIALAYPIVGSTKNIVVLDSAVGPVNVKIAYEKPVAPDVPDTGIFGGVINFARADYVITGVLGFGIVTIFALVFLKKHDSRDRRSSRR